VELIEIGDEVIKDARAPAGTNTLDGQSAYVIAAWGMRGYVPYRTIKAFEAEFRSQHYFADRFKRKRYWLKEIINAFDATVPKYGRFKSYWFRKRARPVEWVFRFPTRHFQPRPASEDGNEEDGNEITPWYEDSW
jgi:hypothetical protein